VSAPITLPGGRDRGKAITDPSVTVRSLEWWAENANTAELKAACAAEIKRRQKGGRPAAPAQRSGGSRAIRDDQDRPIPGTGLAKRKDSVLSTAISDPRAVTERLANYRDEFHLVSPATSCDALPPGCGVAVSLVWVDPNADKFGPGEVYKVTGGKLGLSGTTLKRIGAAAGVDWDPKQSGRLDSGQDPHYCHYRAVGYVRNFDGSERTVSGEVEIDMRDGSPQVIAMEARAKEGSNFESQLRDTRHFLLRHAETKAKLRAIADIGIKRSYTAAELEKPFAVARLMWTGETNDPELKREFARMHAEHMIEGRRRLYGDDSPRPVAQFRGHEPPPVGVVDEDIDDYGGYDAEAVGEEKPPSSPSQEPPAEPPPVGDGYEDRGDNPDNY